MPGNEVMSNWTLFSNHGLVLFCLARDPEARLRDVATDVGITERAVQKIVRDLQDGGMISITKSISIKTCFWFKATWLQFCS